MALLSVSGISRTEKGIFTARDISFTQHRFEKIAVAGETGSGKTTLLKIIAGLLQPDAGEIIFEGKKLKGPGDQLIPGHMGIAYLSQHFELRNNYRVHEILSYANELTLDEAGILYRVCRINHLLDRKTDQLSGGERQRIALAGLLTGFPRLLLLDEPFSNLDAVHKSIIKAVISDINAKLGISCIMVSHDAPDLLSWADTIMVLQQGKIIQQGSPEQVYRQPVNDYCAALFGDYNLVNTEDAALLNMSPGISPNPKKLLLRPEQFTINTGNHGLKAVVQNIFFMGSYYLVEVQTARQLLKVKTSSNAYMPGQSIQLSVSSPAWCYL